MRHSLLLTGLIILSTPALTADPRDWKSSDGGRSIQGEYIKHDEKTITLKLADGRQLTFDLSKLHAEDLAWLQRKHPAANPSPPPPNALFDQLKFGDTRAEVLEKLKQSKAVEMTLDEKFIGRVGLNGVFRTKQKIGGKSASLFFGWTAEGTLSEISLQTDVHPADQYETALKPCWAAMSNLLATLHGTPKIHAELPALDGIAEDSLLASHVWDLKPEGSLMLGTAHQDGGFLIVARFCQHKH